MTGIIFACICGIIAVFATIVSIRSFKEKGFLFNNAYIWASKSEREHLDKKPYYRQTAVVFALIAAIFLSLAAELLFPAKWLRILPAVFTAAALVYAIKSSLK